MARSQPASRPDLLAGFHPLLIAVRWGTIAVGLVVASVARDRTHDLLWGLPLVAYAAFRTWRPLQYETGRVAGLVAVLGEVGINLGVVVATDLWASPYVFCLAAAIIAAGLARGFGFAIRTALAAILAIAIPFRYAVQPHPYRTSLQWGGELLLIALVAGYARRIFVAVEEQSVLARQANELLSQLHLVAQTLPASLDLDETVAATMAQLRQRVPAESYTIMLRENESGDRWTVASSIGTRAPSSFGPADLPAGAAAVAAGAAAQTAGSGLYAPLDARGKRIGIIAVEGAAGGIEAVEEVATAAALAIDNARWFSRLRTVGADEERTRIARDLHDRVGQSLAFVAFELDRIGRQVAGQPVEAELRQLRENVGHVVTEVRDTLYDLRTDVSEREPLGTILAEYAERVSTRTGIDVRCEAAATGRLPLPQERELWRIAQEAITNASRHAEAHHIDVRWESNGEQGRLEVADDGRGLPDSVDRDGAYGLVGMRERAAAIGARLDIESTPGAGTRVRVTVA